MRGARSTMRYQRASRTLYVADIVDANHLRIDRTSSLSRIGRNVNLKKKGTKRTNKNNNWKELLKKEQLKRNPVMGVR